MTTRIIIRGATEIEIILPEGVEPPTVGAAEQARSPSDGPGSSAASTSPRRVVPGNSPWEVDCLHWRGRVLTGKHAHWCDAYDQLPVDETTPEWPCGCYRERQPARCADIPARAHRGTGNEGGGHVDLQDGQPEAEVASVVPPPTVLDERRRGVA